MSEYFNCMETCVDKFNNKEFVKQQAENCFDACHELYPPTIGDGFVALKDLVRDLWNRVR